MVKKYNFRERLFLFKQWIRAVNRNRLRRRRETRSVDYQSWIHEFDTAVPRGLPQAWHEKKIKPILTFWLSMNEADERGVIDAIESVIHQSGDGWRLLVVAGHPELTAPWLKTRGIDDPRILVVPVASGGSDEDMPPWGAELRSGHQLAPHAVEVIAHHLCNAPDVSVVYTDVDELDLNGVRDSPIFRPDWDPDLYLTHAYVHGLVFFRRWRIGQSEDIAILAQMRKEAEGQVLHIPHVLLHQRKNLGSRPHESRLSGVQRYLDDTLPGSTVQPLVHARGLRIHWPLPSPMPLVSIVIPTRNQLELLRKCITSLLEKTAYPSKQIIVVDNGSDDVHTLNYLEEIKRHPGVVVKRDDGPFNYSALNNHAIAELADGEFVVLMNNDVEAIHDDWLTEMISQAARPGIGCVGARLLYSDNTIQHGGVILGIGNNHGVRGVASHAHKALKPDEPGYAGRAQVAQRFCAVTAACLAIRRSTFDLVGGLDAVNLAVAYNDVDFCLRVLEAGFANVWTPHATLYHHESVSRGKDTSSKNLNRFARESQYMRRRWGALLDNDPAYNPNLTQDRASFQLAWPPRVSWHGLLTD